MRGSGDQIGVIQLLSNPATYGVPRVERIDTHASTVFLAGSRAFKLKRAVKYDYLDFSTPAMRKQCCDAEVRINGRTAPSLYRRVIPVVQAGPGRLTLGGEGTPVDWVIEMSRFDQDALFDRMASSGRLDLAHMVTLAEEIASFHESCAVRSDFGGAAGIARVIDGNATGFREYGRESVPAAACESLTLSARAQLRRCKSLLECRRVDGYVRECHGDLHLGNIVLFEDRPTLFDAIEFNEEISCIDVMYDLAFLLMDLWYRRLPAHANSVLNTYLGASHDLEALAVLPLFLSCRAEIRAKTTATAATLASSAPEHQRELQAAARAYLALALRLLQRPAPSIVAIGGLSGSGKSTVARAVAPLIGAVPGAVVLRSDETRKRLWGVSPLTKLDATAYTQEMSACVYDTLASDAMAVVEAGHTAIVDATFARAGDRAVIERAARAAGVAFAGIWLDAPEHMLIERVVRRGPDASDADADVVRMQCAQWADDVQWARVDAAVEQGTVLTRVRAQLPEQRVAIDSAA